MPLIGKRPEQRAWLAEREQGLQQDVGTRRTRA
jgi:hypothetical protein